MVERMMSQVEMGKTPHIFYPTCQSEMESMVMLFTMDSTNECVSPNGWAWCSSTVAKVA
jgi:hypothetical protein